MSEPAAKRGAGVLSSTPAVHVRRNLFLSLTASLAAGACAEEAPRAVTPTVIDVPAAAPPPPSAVASASPSPLSPLPKPSAPPPPAPASEGDDDDDGPSSEGGYAATEGRVAVLQTCGHSAMRFDPKKNGCRDATGTPGQCSGMKRGSCGSFPFPREECDRWKTNFKPGVADRAVACALRLTGPQVCDACYTYRCGYEALMGSCLDNAAASDCATIKKSCSSVTTDQCLAYLSGMSAAGRTKMVACMSGKNGCSWGFYSCSEGLQ
jgi:hypothetical protein